MNVSVNFTKPVPDELYIDSFANGNTKTWTYTGEKNIHVAVSKPFGFIESIHSDLNFRYNPEISGIITVDADVDPDVAYYTSNNHVPERIFVTETLPFGGTYEQISNPVLRDYYSLNYDFENNTWNWTVVTRNKKNQLNDLIDKYRDYINSNITNISSNTQLMQTANTYLQTLDTLETTGKASIPAWKQTTINLGDVPPVPHELIVALNVLP